MIQGSFATLEIMSDDRWEVIGKALQVMASGFDSSPKKDFGTENRRVKFRKDMDNAVDASAVLDIAAQFDKEENIESDTVLGGSGAVPTASQKLSPMVSGSILSPEDFGMSEQFILNMDDATFKKFCAQVGYSG